MPLDLPPLHISNRHHIHLCHIWPHLAQSSSPADFSLSLETLEISGSLLSLAAMSFPVLCPSHSCFLYSAGDPHGSIPVSCVAKCVRRNCCCFMCGRARPAVPSYFVDNLLSMFDRDEWELPHIACPRAKCIFRDTQCVAASSWTRRSHSVVQDAMDLHGRPVLVHKPPFHCGSPLQASQKTAAQTQAELYSDELG